MLAWEINLKTALCICTRNRPNDLQKALLSADASCLSPSQIIVSDDSDENLADQIKAICLGFSRVLYVRGPQRGLSANRNQCLTHLAPDIQAVVFIDDDVILRSEFLAYAVQQLMDTPKQIITGQEIKNGTEITPRNLSFWGHQEVVPRNPQDYHGIVINATIFPRALFADVQFDESLRYGSEEVDICAVAESRGYRIRYCPEMVNHHYPSAINRVEYSQFTEASRLYSTFKRYCWLKKKPWKAVVFAFFAPLHLMGSILKTRQPQAISKGIMSCVAAARYAQSFARTG